MLSVIFKAGNISGVVSVTAEINIAAAEKRYKQGWVDELHTSLDELIPRVREAVNNKEVISFAYVGNVVDLWERLAEEEINVDLGKAVKIAIDKLDGGEYVICENTESGMTFEGNPNNS